MRLLAILCFVFLLSCDEISDSELLLQPTQLNVKVLDENYDIVEGASVYLYRDYLSFSTKTGEVDQATTNANGKAYFTNLEPYNYYMYATFTRSSEIHDNSGSYYNLADFLTENAITSVTVKADYYCPATPTSFEISTVDLVPITKNENWTGEANDNIYAEYIIVRNYDYSGDLYNQDIIASSSSDLKLYGKTSLGEMLRGDDILTSSADYFSLTVDELENGVDTYSLFFVWFASSDDFDNRELIYSGSLSADGDYDFERVDLFDGLYEPLNQSNPYPKRSYVGQTNSTENNYLIFLNLYWQ